MMVLTEWLAQHCHMGERNTAHPFHEPQVMTWTWGHREKFNLGERNLHSVRNGKVQPGTWKSTFAKHSQSAFFVFNCNEIASFHCTVCERKNFFFWSKVTICVHHCLLKRCHKRFFLHKKYFLALNKSHNWGNNCYQSTLMGKEWRILNFSI